MSSGSTASVLLQRMFRHGEAVRQNSVSGTVVVSRLPGGRSRLIAKAPSVKYVLDGEETYSVNGRSCRLRRGDFMLLEGGAETVVRTGSSDGAVGMCIYLPTAEPVEHLDELASPMLAGTSLDPLSAVLEGYAGMLLKDVPAAADLRRMLTGVTPAVHLFLRDFAAKRERLGHSRASARTEVLQRLERARSWIHANSDNPVTLDQIAREAAMSPFHLARTFSEVFGKPPLSYHRSLRLRKAAAELNAGRSSPSELSRSLGYNCLSSFTRAFSAEFGIPPSRITSSQIRNFG